MPARIGAASDGRDLPPVPDARHGPCRVLVTGMAGVGKSSALRLLGARGHRVVDTDDDGWCRQVTSEDGTADWIWREESIGALLASCRRGRLFVAGCRSNQGRFYPRFEHVALLTAPADVLLARIAARTDNPYGKRPEERDRILRHLAEVEPRLRATATVIIDASAPLTHVVRQLEALP